MSDILRRLNPAQREAVTATEGFIRVIAGAGSGKTRALSHRFIYLVNELGILPGNILCVIFTNKASNEMRQRIHALTGDNDTGYINTFHGFCISVLQEDSHAIQYPKRFLVLDNADLQPGGGEGLSILSADDRLSGRPGLSAHLKPAQAEPGQAADRIPPGVRRPGRLLPLAGPAGELGGVTAAA